MTVAELIDLLQQQDPDRIVWASDGAADPTILPVTRLIEHWDGDGILVVSD